MRPWDVVISHAQMQKAARSIDSNLPNVNLSNSGQMENGRAVKANEKRARYWPATHIHLHLSALAEICADGAGCVLLRGHFPALSRRKCLVVTVAERKFIFVFHVSAIFSLIFCFSFETVDGSKSVRLFTFSSE